MYPRDDAYRRTHEEQELLADEVVVDNWKAERAPGVFSSGGMLNLTTQRVLWDPPTNPVPFLGELAALFGYGAVGGALEKGVNAIGTMNPIAVPLESLASAEPLPGSGLRLTARSGDSWDFTILAAHFGRRGTEGARAARDDAIGDITQAIAGVNLGPRGGVPDFAVPALRSAPTAPWSYGAPPRFSPSTPPHAPLAETPADTSEIDFWVSVLPRLRQQAESTGQSITVDEEGPWVVHVTPDGTFRVTMGRSVAHPFDARHPPNLVGVWSMDFLHAAHGLHFRDDGTLGGLVKQFAELPVKPVTGEWWWQDRGNRLTFTYIWSIASAELAEFVRELGFQTFAMQLWIAAKITIGPNSMAGAAEDEFGELVMRRHDAQ
jgi:hypothetical protein